MGSFMNQKPFFRICLISTNLFPDFLIKYFCASSRKESRPAAFNFSSPTFPLLSILLS